MTTHNRQRTSEMKEGSRAETSGKKIYRAPVLTTYGPVSKLTMTGSGSGTDGGSVADHMKQCI